MNMIKICKKKRRTYIEGFLEKYPSRLGVNVKVLEVGGVVGRGEAVPDGPVVVGVLVGGRHAQYVSHDVGVLFHVLHVFLQQA